MPNPAERVRHLYRRISLIWNIVQGNRDLSLRFEISEKNRYLKVTLSSIFLYVACSWLKSRSGATKTK